MKRSYRTILFCGILVVSSATCLVYRAGQSENDPEASSAPTNERSEIRTWISDVNAESFQVHIQNNTNKRIAINTYYPGYSMVVELSFGNKRTFNFGADKQVPPSLLDWVALNAGQALSWKVFFPDMWRVKETPRAISYAETSFPEDVPNFIRKLDPEIEQFAVKINWPPKP